MSNLDEKAQQLLQALANRKLTLGSVESITGGLFASTICSIPGASKVFKGGIVSYSCEVKEKVVGVSKDDIDIYGVVSNHVADAMAKGGRNKLNVDVCVSFTGNAGPTAEPGKAPVGRVYIAISTEHGIVPIMQDFTGERNRIREQAVEIALDTLLAIYAD
jgi:nicotinamide-nucleotide amidase